MSAAISAGTAIGLGAITAAGATAYAANSSAGATQNAANTAANEQKAALAQQEQLAAPYTGLGTTALPQYEALLGIGPNANPATTLAALQKTPGYQFTQQQGEQGILNAASAQGGVGGNTLAALDQYNTGLADQTYQNAVGNIQGAVGLGQAAAAGVGSNIGTAASNLGNIATQQGQTTAGIDSNLAASLSKIAGNTGNQYTTLQYLNGQTGNGGAPINTAPAPTGVNFDGSIPPT